MKVLRQPLPIDDDDILRRVLRLFPSTKHRKRLLRRLSKMVLWYDLAFADYVASRSPLELRKSYKKLRGCQAKATELHELRASLSEDERMELTRCLGTSPDEAAAHFERQQQALLNEARLMGEAASALPIQRVITDRSWPRDPDYPNGQEEVHEGPDDPDDPRVCLTKRCRARPKNHLAHAMMRDLVDLWREEHGKDPSISTKPDFAGDLQVFVKYGPFIDFADALMAPLFRKHGLKAPNIAALARDEIEETDES